MLIRVLIVDDHRLFRQGLRKLLEKEHDIEVVGEADDGSAAQDMFHELCPDIVLMDVKMPKINGVAATQLILKERPETGIIILTMYDGDAHVAQAIQAGARGYVLKTSEAEGVVSAIRAVYQGASLIDPEMTAKLVNEFRRLYDKGRSERSLSMLSDKEIAVLQLLGKGLSNKEIARELNYSINTIKTRLSIIFQKIGVVDRTQAAVYAINHGLSFSVDDAYT